MRVTATKGTGATCQHVLLHDVATGLLVAVIDLPDLKRPDRDEVF